VKGLLVETQHPTAGERRHTYSEPFNIASVSAEQSALATLARNPLNYPRVCKRIAQVLIVLVGVATATQFATFAAVALASGLKLLRSGALLAGDDGSAGMWISAFVCAGFGAVISSVGVLTIGCGRVAGRDHDADGEADRCGSRGYSCLHFITTAFRSGILFLGGASFGLGVMAQTQALPQIKLASAATWLGAIVLVTTRRLLRLRDLVCCALNVSNHGKMVSFIDKEGDHSELCVNAGRLEWHGHGNIEDSNVKSPQLTVHNGVQSIRVPGNDRLVADLVSPPAGPERDSMLQSLTGLARSANVTLAGFDEVVFTEGSAEERSV